MRCSISRTESRYSFSLVRSPGPSVPCRGGSLPASRNRGCCRSRFIRARRCAALPPSPNKRSNTTRGWASAGFGVVGLRHEMVLTKKQSLVSQAPCVGRSRSSSSEGTCVSLPITRGGNLIGRSGQAHLDTGLRAVVGVNAGQPDGRRARMIAGAVAERVGLQVRQPAQHVDVIAHRFERLQRSASSSKSRPTVLGIH